MRKVAVETASTPLWVKHQGALSDPCDEHARGRDFVLSPLTSATSEIGTRCHPASRGHHCDGLASFTSTIMNHRSLYDLRIPAVSARAEIALASEVEHYRRGHRRYHACLQTR